MDPYFSNGDQLSGVPTRSLMLSYNFDRESFLVYMKEVFWI